MNDPIKDAYRRGFWDGMASLFRPAGRRRPVPQAVRLDLGSLHEDMRQLQRDADRLIENTRS